MKRVIIRTLNCICITYMVISVILNMYYCISFKQNINEMKLSEKYATHQEEVYVPNDLTVGDLNNLSNYSGKLEIIYFNFKVVISSIVLGTIIALTTLLKEESKIKFILVFILGYMIINLFFSILTVYIFQNNGVEISFFERYIDAMKYSIIPYISIFIIILLIQKYFLKKKVNELNKIIKK